MSCNRRGALASVTAGQLYGEAEEEPADEQPSTSARAPWQPWEQLWRRPRDDTWRMHREECFPTALRAHGGGLTGGGGACQSLVSVGSRQWGHPAISSLLRVKIYDFAVYMDGAQARQSQLGRAHRGRTREAPYDQAFFDNLRSSDDIEMSLVVRAARNLPIKLLAAEYERILRRRLKRVGGSPDDGALADMVASFNEESLPASIRAGGAVRKGTVLTFRRDAGGQLSAAANALPLVTVRSEPLAAAVFDIYFGEQPVSKRAKKVAGECFSRLVEGDGQGYRAPRERLVCPGDAAACFA
ncbi:hypothetical protein WJX81_006874 [Elliptochloris bilobata]|uniref:Chalcone isomerase domain-containing protein n=1 Tax=Elliptochloris bilobata TaxID=381761 RepID=A0AAW1RIM6_9CHLO